MNKRNAIKLNIELVFCWFYFVWIYILDQNKES
jgi:hypothetical protein